MHKGRDPGVQESSRGENVCCVGVGLDVPGMGLGLSDGQMKLW